MKKKEIEKTKLKPRTKAKAKRDYLEVILERMEHKSDLLSEGFSVLSKNIDNNHEEFKEFRNETNGNFKTLFEFRNETNGNFKTLFEYLSKIDDELQLLKIEIADLKTKLKGKAELKRLMQVEKRMVVAEKKLEAMIF